MRSTVRLHRPQLCLLQRSPLMIFVERRDQCTGIVALKSTKSAAFWLFSERELRWASFWLTPESWHTSDARIHRTR